MLLLLSSVVLLCLLLWLKYKWNRVKRYWAERGVPFHPPHPLMGSLTFLQRENPGIYMRQVYNDFRAPYVGMWLFWRPALIINSPEIARRVLVKDFDNFRNRFLGSGKTDPVGASTLFLADDPLWTSVRKRLTTVFTAAKLRALQSLTITKSRDLVERINVERKKQNPIDLRELYVDYTTDVIGESAFGISSEATKTGDSIIRKLTREYMKFTVFRGLSWSSIFFFPELVDIFRFSLFPKDTTNFLRKLFRKIVEQRGGYEKEINVNNDLLDALIKMRQEAAADDEEMSEDILLAQAAIFLVGGFDSTGAALTWATLELSYQPEMQDRLYKELHEAIQKTGNINFDSTTLSELPYLNAIMKETMRKFPPMGWLDRIAAQSYKIDDNLTIPAGSIVYVNAIGMMSDPDYFPDPEKFDPERFMPENEKNIKPYTFMPFGEGPRNCIGKRFAYQTFRFGLASVFLNFKVTSIPGSPLPNDCGVENKGMFYMPNEKISVVFTPRH